MVAINFLVIDLNEFLLYHTFLDRLKKEIQMNSGKIVFSQIMDFLPLHEFRKCVKRYQGQYKVKSFSCLDQFLSMAFAQLTYRESLRDIEVCLRSMKTKLYHMGIRSKISRNTLSNANEKRNWRIYADFAQILMQRAKDLYINEGFALDINEAIYALDSSIIHLCLTLCPWAYYQKNAGGVRLHTLLNLKSNIPSFAKVTTTKVRDNVVMDDIIVEPGAFYVMDRAYFDLPRLYNINLNSAFFIVRCKSKVRMKRIYSSPIDKSKGLKHDQTIVFSGIDSSKFYPEKLRRIHYIDPETKNDLTFITNNFLQSAENITILYRYRWRIELFFKWIKQHLRIKKFYGLNENAIQTQIWIAISIYVLVAIIKKELKLKHSLYNILQVLSVTAFEKNPIAEMFDEISLQNKNENQMMLRF